MRDVEDVAGGVTSADASTPQGSTFFSDFKQQFSQREAHSHLVLLESLRRLYPDRSITVSDCSIDPIKFAEAGFAKAEFVGEKTSDISLYRYQPENNRLTGGNGRLIREIEFGQYKYTYEAVQSILFIVRWPTADGQGLTSRNYYIAPESDPQSPAWAKSVLTAAGKFGRDLHEEIYVFDNGRWQKNTNLWKTVEKASWDDVILDPVMKDTFIKDVHGFFDSRAVYEEYAVPWKRGIIIHGVPGCGKTISIKALMKEVHGHGAASLYVKSFSSNQGTEQSIRSIFSHARRMAPCMLIFEDLDSLVEDKVRSYFLNEVDGLENNHGILMIGSTNHLDRLDPGISKRPSRFDRKYHYKLPGARERMLYCDYWRGKLQHNSSLDLNHDLSEFITDSTDGFSFAYLKELFVQTLLAIVSGRIDDPEEDVDAAIADAAENTTVDKNSSRLLRTGEKTDNTEDGASTDVSAAHEPSAQNSDRQPEEREIPESLRDSPLARVFHRQIYALRKDMDNTTEEVSKPAKEDKKE